MRAVALAAVRRPLTWILLLAAVLRVQSSGYLRSSDDLVYAQAAQEVVEGRFDPTTGSFHRLRTALILPVAAVFGAFGTRPGSSIAWLLACSLASIAFIDAWVGRRSTSRRGAVAALFTAVATQHVLSGAELFPDSPLLLWTLLAVGL
jgi:4-amino-4-deoxy-L-arabinose transferase-like glycosyltransferase